MTVTCGPVPARDYNDLRPGDRVLTLPGHRGSGGEAVTALLCVDLGGVDPPSDEVSVGGDTTIPDDAVIRLHCRRVGYAVTSFRAARGLSLRPSVSCRPSPLLLVPGLGVAPHSPSRAANQSALPSTLHRVRCHASALQTSQVACSCRSCLVPRFTSLSNSGRTQPTSSTPSKPHQALDWHGTAVCRGLRYLGRHNDVQCH